MIRLLLVDDHASVRDPLAFLLDQQQDMRVCGVAGSLAEARTLLRDIDLAILDLDLPDGRGTALIKDLHAASPRARVLILTGSESDLDKAAAIDAGAEGFLRKSARMPEVLNAIRQLAAGERLHRPDELMHLLQMAARQRERDQYMQQQFGTLTAREHELVRALADGLSDKEIAERHVVSVRTVQTQMARLLDKLGVESRLQVLVQAIRHGIISIDS